MRLYFFYLFILIMSMGCSHNSIQEQNKSWNTLNIYKKKGVQYFNNNSYVKAVDSFQKAYKLNKQLPNRHGYNTSLALIANNLGISYHRLFELKNAEKYYQKALEINIEEKNNLAIANNYNNLATVYDDFLEYEKALDFYEKALKINIDEHNQTREADNYNNIGYLYIQLGDFNNSIKNFQKSLEINLQLDNLENQIQNYLNLAFAYENQGVYYPNKTSFKKALIFSEKALKISDDLCKNKNIKACLSQSTIYNNLGYHFARDEVFTQMNVVDQNKFNKKAEEDLNKSLEIKKIYLELDDPNFAVTYNNLGLIYLNQGKLSKSDEKAREKFLESLRFHKKALKIRQMIYGDKHNKTARSYHNIGLTYKYLKNYKMYYVNIKKSFDIFLKERDQHFSMLSNHQKINYINIRKKEIYKLLDASYLLIEEYKQKGNWAEISKLTKEVFEYWINYKGTIFDYENTLSLIYNKTKDSFVKNKISELNNAKRTLAKLYQQDNKIKKLNQENFILTQREIVRIEQELNSKVRDFKNLKNITISNLLKVINENTLYIDYAKTDFGYYFFTLDHENNISYKYIGFDESKQIDKIINIFRDDISKHISTKDSFTDDDIKRTKKLMSKLYHLLFLSDINQTQQILFSLDGLLHFFPFEALYNQKEHKYLIELFDIKYIPSAKEAVRIKENEKLTKKSDFIVFSNPDYYADLTSLTNNINLNNRNNLIESKTTRSSSICLKNQASFDSLEGINTNKTIKTIMIDLFEKKHVSSFTEKNASEKELLRMNNPKILHLATHGFFCKNREVVNPLLKSGLAFSGANFRVKNRGEGVVWGLKLAGLNLQNTDLVILSACETGLGVIQEGEGVFSLNKAFIMAGSSNVIMSLWKVNNNYTTNLMEVFYKTYRYLSYKDKNNIFSKSLRKGKLRGIKQNIHPYFWASFVLNGI